MIRRLLLATASAVMMLALTSVARADTVTFSGGFGVTATVTNFSLNGNQFTFTVNNTSASGSITALGFNLPGTRPNYTLTARTDADFALGNDVSAQAGAQNITNSFDFALLTGNNFGGGTVSEGVGSNGSATFTITGDFSGLTAEQIARAIILRFQGIGPRDESTIGTANPNAPIPEPMTMLLLGTGLAGVAAKVRSRRRKE